MIDAEVQRLRRLRAGALHVRAAARALSRKEQLRDADVLTWAGCAAWRIARAVSGHLRAHPYASFQKGPSIATLVGNALAAKIAAAGASSRAHAFRRLEAKLKLLARSLDDARALTRAPDLSDLFGRSQREIRALLVAVAGEVRAAHVQQARAPLDLQRRGAAVEEGDWPYLAFFPSIRHPENEYASHQKRA